MIAGVLALQGGFAAHARALESLGIATREVRRPEHLVALDGLVLPGGESTVQLDLIARMELEAPLAAFVASGKPVLATCAGLILCARAVAGGQRSFAFLDVEVARNAWGRQSDSFEALADDGTPLVFIRAPRIVSVANEVDVLCTYLGEPVFVRQRNVFGATFHPELTGDPRAHRLAFSAILSAHLGADARQRPQRDLRKKLGEADHLDVR